MRLLLCFAVVVAAVNDRRPMMVCVGNIHVEEGGIVWINCLQRNKDIITCRYHDVGCNLKHDEGDAELQALYKTFLDV